MAHYTAIRIGVGLLATLVLLVASRADDRLQATPKNPETVRVILREHDPDVIRDGETVTGFGVDLIEEIARRKGWKMEVEVVARHEQVLEALVDGRADIALGGMSIDSERNLFVDYVRVYALVPLRTLILDKRDAVHELGWAMAALVSPEMLVLYAIGIAISLVAGIIIRSLERRNRDRFPSEHHQSVWWAGQTFLAHNCGERIPSTHLGRTLTLFLMISGTIFTAQITAVLTTNLARLLAENAPIETPADFGRRLVGTVRSSFAARWLESNFCRSKGFDTPIEAVQALQAGKVDAVVYDEDALVGVLKQLNDPTLTFVGTPFAEHPHAILLQPSSPLSETLNACLVGMMRDGTLNQLKRRWSLRDPANSDILNLGE